MADLTEVIERSKVVIRQHFDQIKVEAWDLLQEMGVEWVENFDEATKEMQKMDLPLGKALGLLSQVGLCALYESWEPSPW